MVYCSVLTYKLRTYTVGTRNVRILRGNIKQFPTRPPPIAEHVISRPIFLLTKTKLFFDDKNNEINDNENENKN